MRPLALPLCLFLAAPALAQDAAPPASAPQPARPGQPPATIVVEPVAMMIAAFDADGDARVTHAELDAGLRRSFDSIDAGHAGSIGYIAFSDWSERWLGSRNALPDPFEVDRNDDNRITYDELAQRFALFFARFDTNRDGAIARSELIVMRTPLMIPPERRGRGRQRGE